MRSYNEIDKEWRDKYGYNSGHLCILSMVTSQHGICAGPGDYNADCTLEAQTHCKELFERQQERLLPPECPGLGWKIRFEMWKGIAYLMVRQKKGEVTAQQVEEFKKTCVEVAEYYAEQDRQREERNKKHDKNLSLLESL